MPSPLERRSSTSSLVGSGGMGLTPVSRRTGRALSALEERTLVRAAAVQGESYVQVEKTKALDNLAREAMSGQAMLAKWAQTLAAGDPFVADELKFFSDLARMGKGEIIADTIDTFCRESRR
jgi:hypothetical protein